VVDDDRPPLLAGAYAASPSKNGWDAALESRFVEGLRGLGTVSTV
jgi:hypothetical protein